MRSALDFVQTDAHILGEDVKADLKLEEYATATDGQRRYVEVATSNCTKIRFCDDNCLSENVSGDWAICMATRIGQFNELYKNWETEKYSGKVYELCESFEECTRSECRDGTDYCENLEAVDLIFYCA